MKVDNWLVENTYHHGDFQDIERLVDLKNKKNLTIDVSLPTLNEEKTIAKEILLIQTELMIKHELVDKIAVVDSGSSDRTREIAEKYGAEVFLASDYLPEQGDHRGKGENLWKSLYLLEGDIIVYIDADIKNIAPKFVYGLVGPLLERDEISYVKGFYERPLQMGEEVRTGGGGRVTEILIRPLFNLFFPDLAGLLQPLSGEYAGRRELLEKLPFFIGYGVETGLLIDISEQFGIETIAQVDLDKRVHQNQDLQSLGKMAFGILQTFFNRLDAAGKVKIKKELKRIFRQIEAIEDGHRFENLDMSEIERPPMVDIDKYRQKFNIGKSGN
ncbi:MAG: glucosyl-3-phosphoglycerate synthase [bacterium]